MAETNKRFHINPYILVILSFIMVILIGSFFLCMPWARVDGHWGWNSYIDQLFVSVSATCVTGLCTYETGIAGTLTFPGQLIMLFMIQVGGLGFITVLTFILTLFKTKLQFKDRYILSQAVNSTSVADVVRFVRKVILITVTIEVVGACIGLPVFLTMFPDNPWLAIWNSFFTACSAFNNAGFDIVGATSLMNEGLIGSLPPWAYNYLLIYVMVLVILGGLSFLVIIDMVLSKKSPKQWRAFTKITITMTVLLLVFGFIIFLVAECFKETNPMSPLDAIFQSVTCRTAGFASYNQNDMTLISKVTSCALMFIGGSPLSTAGGIKITTIYMIALAMICYFRGKPVSSFKRVYSTGMVIKAMSLFLIALGVVLGGFLIINAFESSHEYALNTPENLFFEVFSAFGTTGLTAGITTQLQLGSKITLCILMFLGRLGPMTFFQIFQKNLSVQISSHYQYVEEDFLIG